MGCNGLNPLENVLNYIKDMVRIVEEEEAATLRYSVKKL